MGTPDNGRALLEQHQRNLRSAIARSSDRSARLLCESYLRKVEHALSNWTRLDGAELFGDRGYGPGIEAACRDAEPMQFMEAPQKEGVPLRCRSGSRARASHGAAARLRHSASPANARNSA